MAPALAEHRQLRPQDLLIGIFAVLSRDGENTLRINDESFHSAFGAALSVFRRKQGPTADVARLFYRDLVSKTYRKLDDSLAVAQRYGYVKIFNPTFEMLEINMTPRVAAQILSDWDEHKAIFEEAAQALRRKAAGRSVD